MSDKYKLLEVDRGIFEAEINRMWRLGYTPIWETYKQWATRKFPDGETEYHISIMLEKDADQKILGGKNDG